MQGYKRHFRKLTLTEVILQGIEHGLHTSAELIDACLSIYPESYRRARAGMLGYDHRKKKRKPPEDSDYVLRHRLFSQISYLRKRGFIEKNELEITARGKKMLEKLKERLGFARKNYKKEEDGKLNIIIFDVPEKERAKRDWLRFELKHLGFHILQKSVWVGKARLPMEFLEDLEILGIRSKIHIFRISKEDEGTLSGN